MEFSNSLPAQLKLFNFAKKEVSLSGQYQISDLPRISEIASNKTDKININLSFYLDNDKTPCIDGIISLDIVLICQRCLEELNISLKVRFNLAFDSNDKKFFIFNFFFLRNYSNLYHFFTIFISASKYCFIWRKNYGPLVCNLSQIFFIHKNNY